jgi:predicted ATPase
MIKSLQYKRLFGVDGNDGELQFHADLNIITGRNGSGKTTILKILWYVVSGHYDILIREIDFSYLKVVTDLAEFEIIKGDMPTYTLNIDYQTAMKDANKSIKNYILQPILEPYHSSLFFPTFRRIEGGFTIVPKVGEQVVNNEIYEAFNQLSNRLSNTDSVGIYKHKFIAYVSTNDLNRLLNDEIAYMSNRRKSIESQKDKDVKKMVDASHADIVERIEQAEREIALLDAPFRALNELVTKYMHKNILLTDKLAIGNPNIPGIPSQRLSSGEKQLFAFLCYNIFAKNSSIFIDEPELSLHPNWQRQLIPFLEKQSSTNQFFMATHSAIIAAPYQHREIIINADKGER